jgi:UDP-N-acetylglucosamine acyltransferase
MSTHIHPTALIEPSVTLPATIEIGPYAIVEAGVTLAEGVRILAQAQVLSGTQLGPRVVVGRGAVIGGEPQDLSFDASTVSGVIIGADTVIREHVTIHRASVSGGFTRLGEKNLLMAGCHLGHDVVIGDQNVIANHVMFGGFVHMGNRCFIGGGTGFHQFVRVGDLVMLQGNGGFTQDVPPYALGSGINIIHGLNTVGLKRAGLSPAERAEIKKLYRMLWATDLRWVEALAAAQQLTWSPAAQRILDFVTQPSKKGLLQPVRPRLRSAQGRTSEVE